jgi:molybdate transport system substrate-binding protein
MMRRLKGREVVDVVILSAPPIAELTEAGIIARGSAVNLATCEIGVAVKAGAPKPDLSSREALKRAVLAAKSIVYSHGPSGIYLERLFERMGISDEIRHKVKRVQGQPSGEVVAQGEAELGFQQVCELLPVPGIDFVAPLPPDVQEITTFTAGVHANSKEPEAAKALLEFFTSPEAVPVIKSKGMEPLSPRRA